jgi:hypothetical protein
LAINTSIHAFVASEPNPGHLAQTSGKPMSPLWAFSKSGEPGVCNTGLYIQNCDSDADAYNFAIKKAGNTYILIELRANMSDPETTLIPAGIGPNMISNPYGSLIEQTDLFADTII